MRQAWWHPEVPPTARFDLSLTTMLAGGRLSVTFLYRPDLFDQAPVAALADRYVRLVERAVAEPDRPLGDFALVPDDELERLHRRNDPARVQEATVVEPSRARPLPGPMPRRWRAQTVS